ncbi:MAG: DMT family protein [Pseudomonadota bacterium]|nr:DMT family protein [Pseudomonadota bacterium]
MLVVSNVFMTFAWYGHLRDLREKPLWIAIAVSWGIAFFEYCVQVPANRLGYSAVTLAQLKILQEIVTLVVFAGFAVFWMGEKLTWNYAAAGLCMCAAAWFMFRA